MALKVTTTIDKTPLQSQRDPGDFLFSPEWVQKLYQSEETIRFLNLKSDDFQLSIPLIVKGGMPGKRIVMPQYIPYFSADVQINPTLTTARKTSIQRHVSTALAKALDDLKPVLVELNFLSFYWLPFHWAGFDVKPRITYRLQTAHIRPQRIFAEFRDNIKRQIRKSEKQNKIVEAGNSSALFDLNKESYERKGDDHPFNSDLLHHLFNTLRDDNAGKILEVHNPEGKVIAAALFAWDAHFMYYLTGGVRESAKNSGAMAHVVWEGIQRSHHQNLTFDFEGSLNPGIERFFSSFGATPFTYYQVRKSNSKLYDLYQNIKS
jgi:hypothetical protein